MIGWIITAVLIALALLPVGVRVLYDGSFRLWLVIAFAKIPILSDSAPKKDKVPKTEAEEPQTTDESAEKKSLFRLDLRHHWKDYLSIAWDLLGGLRRKLLLRELIFLAYFGGKEPDERALNYGRAWSAIGVTMPMLEQSFRIRRRDVRAVYDEAAQQIRLYLSLCISIRLGQLIFLALRALRRFLVIQKKAVNENEQSNQ